MSNTSFDASGVLLFDGPARVTPVIQMLFRPFHLNATDSGHNDRCTIEVLSSDARLRWESYLEQLIDSILGRVAQMPTADILPSLGRRYGADLRSFAESTSLEERVEVADVVRLALVLRDGHNLLGFSMQGARKGEGNPIGAYGGWASHVNPQCSINLSTGEIIDFAEQLTDALDAKGAAPARLIDETLTHLITAIHDPSQQRALKLRYALPIVDHLARLPSVSHWERTVYVGAYATDDGDGPQWARLTATPAFLGRLRQLRGLCLAQELTQLQVADVPFRWGFTWPRHRTPLSNCRLVVTPTTFFYTASPGRHVHSIQTEPLSIDWFVSNVCGPGTPIHLKVNSELVRDEIGSSD
jgi:hypothetical protein